MDRDYLGLAHALAKPAFVVDSLFWMRDRIPDEFRAARRYWVQDFVGVRARLAETGIPARVVGPIVRHTRALPPKRRTGLVAIRY